MQQQTCALILAATMTLGISCGFDAGQNGAEEPDVAVIAQPQIGPDDNLEDFPYWVWPYIRPASIYFKYLNGEIEVEVAQKAMRAAVEDCACALGSRKATPEAVLAAVDMVFGAQLTAARLAPHSFKTVAQPQSNAGFAAFDDDWRCGTGPFPKWPVPPRGNDLVKLQGQELIKSIQANVKLDRAATAALVERVDLNVAEIGQQFER
jgi:hypothetical protein